ncbi:MAG: glycosyltransferase, partial [Ferruginibacter sp.]
KNPFKYLHQSSCFVLGSLTEGFPNILIESMICELPIIAVDCKTGPRELLAPGTGLHTAIKNNEFEIAAYGLLCKVNAVPSLVSAMEWALDHPDKLKEFSSKALEKTAEFDFKKVAANLTLTFDKYLKR